MTTDSQDISNELRDELINFAQMLSRQAAGAVCDVVGPILMGSSDPRVRVAGGVLVGACSAVRAGRRRRRR